MDDHALECNGISLDTGLLKEMSGELADALTTLKKFNSFITQLKKQ
ncbi:unnamed protein product, partial [marine sediment metagenome]